MDLSLQQLRMLHALDSHGTIAAAAEALGYTPSAVSQQLSAAEKVTGVAVLERVGRNVVLTDAGRELVFHAGVVLAQLEEAKASLERVRGEVAGTITVGLMESVGSTILGQLVGLLRDRYPALNLRTVGACDAPFQRVRSAELDIAFVLDQPAAPTPRLPDIEREFILDDWFKLVVPTERYEAGEFSEPIELASLAGEAFVVPPYGDACGRVVFDSCRRAGFEPIVSHELDDYPVAARLVAAGVAVALMPDLARRHLPEGVTELELAEPFSRTVELAYRTASAQRPVIRAVADAVRDVVRGLGFEPREPAPALTGA